MKPRGRRRARKGPTAAAVILLLFGVLVASILVRAARRAGGARSGSLPGADPSTAGRTSAQILPVAPDLPPLPLPRGALPRPVPVVQAAYEFAARHPEVLERLPCFCGCERLGHSSNRHCFVSGRQADGRVTWDAHGMG